MSAPAVPMTAKDELRRLWVLIFINFVDMVGFAIVLPLLPFYALRLHASEAMVGPIIAAFSLAQLVSAPIWGRVSDRYGRRPALMIGLVASTAAYAVFGLATSVWMLLLSRLVQGAGGGTTGVAQAYVADTIAPERRAQALGWLSAATSAGVAFGPTIGSLAFHMGHQAPGYIAAALCAANAIFAWLWLPESRVLQPGAPVRKKEPVWSAALRVLEQPSSPSSRLVFIYAAGMLAFTSVTSVLTLFLRAEFKVNETTIGYFYTYVGVLSVVIRALLLGPVVRRIGEVRAMQAGALTLILGMVLYPLAGSIPLLAAVIPLVPIGTALLFPASTSLLSRSVDRSELGITMGVAQTFAGVSRVIAPVLAAAAFQRIGHAAPFLLGAAVVAGVSLLAFRIEVAAAVPARGPASAPAAPAAPADVPAATVPTDPEQPA